MARRSTFVERAPYAPDCGLVRNNLNSARTRAAFEHDMNVKGERLAEFARCARMWREHRLRGQ